MISAYFGFFLQAKRPLSRQSCCRSIATSYKDIGPGFGGNRIYIADRSNSRLLGERTLLGCTVLLNFSPSESVQGIAKYGLPHDMTLSPWRACRKIGPRLRGADTRATSDGTSDLVYLTIGAELPGDVCTYPDSGQLAVDGLERRGFLREADYYKGQPQPTPLLTRGHDASG